MSFTLQELHDVEREYYEALEELLSKSANKRLTFVQLDSMQRNINQILLCKTHKSMLWNQLIGNVRVYLDPNNILQIGTVRWEAIKEEKV